MFKLLVILFTTKGSVFVVANVILYGMKCFEWLQSGSFQWMLNKCNRLYLLINARITLSWSFFGIIVQFHYHDHVLNPKLVLVAAFTFFREHNENL